MDLALALTFFWVAAFVGYALMQTTVAATALFLVRKSTGQVEHRSGTKTENPLSPNPNYGLPVFPPAGR